VTPIEHDELVARLAVVEAEVRGLHDDTAQNYRELRREVTEIRERLRVESIETRAEIHRQHAPMSRSEKVAFAGVSVGVVSAATAALALILRAP
jgi:hypothetical protein